MTDHFEKAVQQILKEAKDNGGVTTDHLLNALVATNDDLDAQHDQTKKWHSEVRLLLETHFEEAEVRDERLSKLEAYREDTERNCAARIKQLWKNEHEPLHEAHVKEMHKLDEEAYDIKKVYRMLKWALVVLGGGVLLILADQIGNLIFGGAT